MIKYPERFSQARPAGFDGVFNWDFLKPAFVGTNIEPMDIDAVVERKGKFLFFETKDVGVKIPLGQQITLKRLVLEGRGKNYVMVLYGKSEREIEAMEEWYYKNGDCAYSGVILCDASYVVRRVTAWFKWANGDKNEGPQ